MSHIVFIQYRTWMKMKLIQVSPRKYPTRPSASSDTDSSINIHLLDDAASNIIFILSRQKYWLRAQPETNIFSRDKINIMLDMALSKQVFYYTQIYDSPTTSILHPGKATNPQEIYYFIEHMLFSLRGR